MLLSSAPRWLSTYSFPSSRNSLSPSPLPYSSPADVLSSTPPSRSKKMSFEEASRRPDILPHSTMPSCCSKRDPASAWDRNASRNSATDIVGASGGAYSRGGSFDALVASPREKPDGSQRCILWELSSTRDRKHPSMRPLELCRRPTTERACNNADRAVLRIADRSPRICIISSKFTSFRSCYARAPELGLGQSLVCIASSCGKHLHLSRFVPVATKISSSQRIARYSLQKQIQGLFLRV